MPQWNEKQLEEFATLIKREREALNEFEHLMRLVDDLLDVQRISRGRVTLQRERLELGALVARTGTLAIANDVVDSFSDFLDVRLIST